MSEYDSSKFPAGDNNPFNSLPQTIKNNVVTAHEEASFEKLTKSIADMLKPDRTADAEKRWSSATALAVKTRDTLDGVASGSLAILYNDHAVRRAALQRDEIEKIVSTAFEKIERRYPFNDAVLNKVADLRDQIGIHPSRDEVPFDPVVRRAPKPI